MSWRSPTTRVGFIVRSFMTRKRSLIIGSVLLVLALASGLIASTNSRDGTGSGLSQGFHWPFDFSGRIASYDLTVRVHRYQGVPSDPIQRSIYMFNQDQQKSLQRLDRHSSPQDELQPKP